MVITSHNVLSRKVYYGSISTLPSEEYLKNVPLKKRSPVETFTEENFVWKIKKDDKLKCQELYFNMQGYDATKEMNVNNHSTSRPLDMRLDFNNLLIALRLK